MMSLMQPSPGRERDAWTRRVACTALLLAISVGFYWKLVLTNQYTWLDSPDIANLEVPRLQFQASEWHHLRFPAWDPNEWCGQPFLGQIAGAAYPLNWPLSLIGFREGHLRQDVLHWYYVLTHFLAALFMFWLCRDVGTSQAAALLAGCLFSFGGYLSGSDWPTVLNGCIWTPLVVLFLLRAGRGDRPVADAAVAGAMAGISWLSGHHQAPYYITLAGLAMSLWFAIRGRDWRALRIAAVFGVFTALVGGLQLVPGFEYGRLALRWAGWTEPLGWKDVVPFSVHQHYAFTPAHLLGILVPAMSVHVTVFVGIAGFALAVAGIAAGWRRPAVRIFITLGIAALLLSMASHNVLYGPLYALVPMFEKSRVPARLILLFTAAIAPLAAFGFDALAADPSGLTARRLRTVLLGLGAALVALYAGLAAAGRPTVDEGFAMLALASLLFGLLLLALERGAVGRTAFALGAIAIVLIELGTLQNFAFQLDSKRDSVWRKLRQHDDIAQFLKRQPLPLRVKVDEQAIPYNFGDWHGIETSGGYLAGLTEDLFRMATHTDRMQNLLGVGYAISKEPTRPGQTELFRGESGLSVWRNPDAFPRAWTVHEAISPGGMETVRARLGDDATDLRRTALFPAPAPSLEPAAGDESIAWERHGAGSLSLLVDMRSRGLVIVSDTWFPGWHASVDGRRAEVLQVDGSLRAVMVPAGRHRVEMRYRPVSAYVGASMTISGLLGALLLAFRRRRP